MIFQWKLMKWNLIDNQWINSLFLYITWFLVILIYIRLKFLKILMYLQFDLLFWPDCLQIFGTKSGEILKLTPLFRVNFRETAFRTGGDHFELFVSGNPVITRYCTFWGGGSDGIGRFVVGVGGGAMHTLPSSFFTVPNWHTQSKILSVALLKSWHFANGGHLT